MRGETGTMEGVKAHLTLRYRPVSDTVTAFVRTIVTDDGEEITGFDREVTSEKLDADTVVEWAQYDGADMLVALQQMHASVRTMVEGLPPVVALLAGELIEHARENRSTDTGADLMQAFDAQHDVELSTVRRPKVVVAKRRAARATSKGVEAALVGLAERIETQHVLTPDEAPVVWAIRDLAYSISDGEGLSSERSADAAARTIANSGMRSQVQRQQLMSIVNDLRHQSNWPRAIASANSSFGAEPALDVQVDTAGADD